MRVRFLCCVQAHLPPYCVRVHPYVVCQLHRPAHPVIQRVSLGDPKLGLHAHGHSRGACVLTSASASMCVSSLM